MKTAEKRSERNRKGGKARFAKMTPEECQAFQRSGVEASVRKRRERAEAMVQNVLRVRAALGIIAAPTSDNPPPEVQRLVDGIGRRLDRIRAREALAASLFCKYDLLLPEKVPRIPPGSTVSPRGDELDMMTRRSRKP